VWICRLVVHGDRGLGLGLGGGEVVLLRWYGLGREWVEDGPREPETSS